MRSLPPDGHDRMTERHAVSPLEAGDCREDDLDSVGAGLIRRAYRLVEDNAQRRRAAAAVEDGGSRD